MAICNREECGVEIRVDAEAEAGGGDVVVYKKGAWSKEEDEKLKKAVEEQGIKNWVKIEKTSGLGRPAKNCRLRWLNYLRPNLKKYPFTQEEERLIVDLHSKFGNSWARIADKLAGRSDNEIKNFWHKRAKKCKRENVPLYEEEKQSHRIQHELPNNSQFQPSTPYIVNHAQSIVSTPQPQFLSSPTTTLLNTPPTTPLTHNSFTQMDSPTSPSPQTTDSELLNSPISPLKLRLSSSAPVQSSSTIPDAKEPPSIQVENDSNLELEEETMMEELRKAQERVRFLKNKLKKSRQCPDTTADVSSSSQSTIKDSSRSEDPAAANAPPKTPKKKDVRRKGDAIGISKPQVKKAKKGKTTWSGSSGSKKSSPSEILKRISSENLQEQTPSKDVLDHLNVPSSQGLADKCSSSMEGFLNESSTALLQDGFFKGDFYGQTSLIENPFSSQRHAPLIPPLYSQSSTTTHGDELISYLQPDDHGFSFMDGCGSDLLMPQNTTSADLLDFDFLRCEHFSLQNSVGCSSESQPSFMQHHDLLNSSYQTCKQLMEQESETAKIHETAFVQHQVPETSMFDSRYMMGFEHEMDGLLADNLWPQGQMEAHDQTFPANRVDSVINPMESIMDWNNESTSGYTGGYL